jgi:hypothetical protein
LLVESRGREAGDLERLPSFRWTLGCVIVIVVAGDVVIGLVTFAEKMTVRIPAERLSASFV